MSRINNYGEFINEEFFKKLRKKPNLKIEKSNTDSCVEEILSFLNDNKIFNWDDFLNARSFNKDVINKIIDHHAKDMKDVQEIRFKLKLELFNRNQLKDFLKELESNEEYEKCSQVLKKMNIR